MSTDFALALDAWQAATIDVLIEGASLAIGPVSDEVRVTEMARPMEAIHDDLVGGLSSQSEALSAHFALGLRALAVMLEHVAFEVEAS